jgi:pimeloyl-ACP methyl ester carboxylesterase
MTAAPTEIRIRADGNGFRGLEWPGGRPLALLVHATSFCADVWRPAWEAARAAGSSALRAVAVDQRGHGASFVPDSADAYAWDLLARDVIALVDAICEEWGERDVVLVGHSSGGTACLAAAGMRPEGVRAVAVVEPVLFEPPPGPDADSFAGSRALSERAGKRRSVYPSRSAALEALRARFPYSGFSTPALDAYLDGGFSAGPDGSVELSCSPEAEAWAYRGAASLDLWPHVERIRAPLLVLAAEHSAMPPPLLERLTGAVAEVRVDRINAATHFAALERPIEVGARLGRFAAQWAGS